PPLCIHGCAAFPHGVPRIVAVAIRADSCIASCPAGGEPKEICAEVIVITVESELDKITFDRFIAPGELRLNKAWLAVEHSHADINRIVVDKNSGFCFFGGGLPFV